MEPMEALASLPLTQSELVLARLRRCVPHVVREAPAGSVVAAEGQPLGAVLVVQSGVLSLTARARSGKRALLSFLGPGEVLGEAASVAGTVFPGAAGAVFSGAGGPVSPGAASASWLGGLPAFFPEVRAVVHSKALLLSASDLPDALRRDPILLAWLHAALARRMRKLERALTRALSLPVRDRVLDALSELASLHGRSTPQGRGVLVPVSQEDLGAMVGATRESVNRAIRHLVRDGAVRRWNGSYAVEPRPGDGQRQDDEPGVS